MAITYFVSIPSVPPDWFLKILMAYGKGRKYKVGLLGYMETLGESGMGEFAGKT